MLRDVEQYVFKALPKDALLRANPAGLRAIAASSCKAWDGPTERLTAAIYKAVISSSPTVFDGNPFLAKQYGTAFACLFEKFECE